MPPARTDRTIYLRVLGPLVLAVMTLLFVGVGGFQVLSAARAYVGGESLWSKARGRAVEQLRDQVMQAQPPADCAQAIAPLEVPLGDRAARLALEQASPDWVAARAGFARGGNTPEDITGLMALYRYFGDTFLLREPVARWRRGDELIAQLQRLGERICSPVGVQERAARAEADLRELDRLEAELIVAETGFLTSLGQASRRTEALLSSAITLVALALLAGGAWFVTRSLRAQIRQQRALVEVNARWELAAEAAGVGVFVWHAADDAVELDARARRLHGLDPQAAASTRRTDFLARLHSEDRDRLADLVRSAVRDHRTLQTRYRVLTADGSTSHIEATGTLRETPAAPDSVQMFGVMREVTDEVARAQLQVDKEAAEQSARARTEFLSRLSHELRTPLNAILGFAQVLQVDAAHPLSALQRQRVKLILDGGWHLLHLVDDVLDITSIDSGQVSIQVGPTELLAVIRASLALIDADREKLNIRIDDRVPTHAAQVLADPRRLQQVFVNLFSNGCKYNRAGGTLTLGYREDAQHVWVRVEDQGLGMTPQQTAQLFQPFKRPGPSNDIPGIGLGLVVVKLLIEQMGGRIVVSSTPGSGSCFTVCLPRAPS